MKTNKSIEAAMRHHSLVFFIMAIISLIGIWSLYKMNKDEFPRFTIRQGVIAAVYPGADAEEIEAQVTKDLEDFLFTYEEIDKTKTYSITEDGIVYIFAELHENVTRKDEVWSKIRSGLELFKKTDLPPGVVQIAVMDDFGNTSSMLLAIESPTHSPKELEDCAEELASELRSIPQMGRIKILGKQREEIALNVDASVLESYGIERSEIFGILAANGLKTLSAKAGDSADGSSIKVAVPYDNAYEIGEQLILLNPEGSKTLKLKELAEIERRYERGSNVSYHSEQTGKASSLIISMEMLPNNNIVEFGKEVDKVIKKVSCELPKDIRMHRISDQPKVVESSVLSFLRDILFSMLVVILVMLLLFPFKTAMVAALAVPVCISICFTAMYATGIELHTVTLAALIVVLGMIVDNSVIVVDGYTNMLESGKTPWKAATTSSSELFVATLIATLSVSAMFFPLTKIITGPVGEFVQAFPWTVTFALLASFIFAFYVTPYLCTKYIKAPQVRVKSRFEKAQDKFFTFIQRTYKSLLVKVFRRPWLTMAIALLLIAAGIMMFRELPIQMMPKADRDSFAVEIHLQDGSSLERSEELADSLSRILCEDPRVLSTTCFVGMSSPRFHATYAPQTPKDSYAQLIVNTKSAQSTLEILSEYPEVYENAFTDAYVRFKQMDYQAVRNPIEVFFQGDDYKKLGLKAEELKAYLAEEDNLMWIHSDYDQSRHQIKVKLRPEEAARLGITQSSLSIFLSGMFDGQTLTTVWEGDTEVPVSLYCQDADGLSYEEIANVKVPTIYPGVSVPLQAVADVEASWHHSSLGHRNGKRTVTVSCDLPSGVSQSDVQKRIESWIYANVPSDSGISVRYGGLQEVNSQLVPEVVLSVLAALLVMFAVLLYHFKKVSLSLLTLSSCALCLFGSFAGLYVFGMDISITAVLGMISLVGIVVRNAIIFFEYADELRLQNNMSGRDAAFEAGLRRMKPIFLTSATTALGVVPMILARTTLWMPMGVVICFGTLLTLPLIVTVLPVAYWKLYAKK
ncbi:MAG: efflux RND transporter permease subunit [Candidatus Cryptobacteroides sp.]